MLYRDLSARENLEFFAKLYGVAIRRIARSRCQRHRPVAGSSDPVRNFSRGMIQPRRTGAGAQPRSPPGG
jgi:ABC-type multidrug transport system ATPase subunit